MSERYDDNRQTPPLGYGREDQNDKPIALRTRKIVNRPDEREPDERGKRALGTFLGGVCLGSLSTHSLWPRDFGYILGSAHPHRWRYEYALSIKLV